MTDQSVAVQPDWRAPELRPEVFQRLYTYMLTYRNWPGCVYFVLPYVADQLDWGAGQRYWAAWLNANTQNPITTLRLMEVGDNMAYAERVGDYVMANWHELQWDTDRKYQKKDFAKASLRYQEMMVSAGGSAAYWRGVRCWDDAWRKMTALPTMGRLSSWSGLEYYRLLTDAPIPNADTLMLQDASGSRSHRNALALLAGRDEALQDKQLNPGLYENRWTDGFVADLETLGASLLKLAERRNPDQPDVGYLTLESCLCTWKSWHKKNRRYANVYADMMHERLLWAEARHGHRFGVLWDARLNALPPVMRLEVSPTDPGVNPIKQNWYRDQGQVPMMGHMYPDMWSDFDDGVREGAFGVWR